jgi:hypothetical protein
MLSPVRARPALAAALLSLLLPGCGILGPTPDVAQACSDVGEIVGEGMRASRSAVKKGPKPLAAELRTLGDRLQRRSESIDDDQLKAAVERLADSYRDTAAVTTDTRIPDAGQVRREAYDVDRICKN